MIEPVAHLAPINTDPANHITSRDVRVDLSSTWAGVYYATGRPGPWYVTWQGFIVGIHDTHAAALSHFAALGEIGVGS